MDAIELRAVKKVFKMGETEVSALRGATFKICAGEFVAIMGASGSGKSTLMNLLGCLDRPTSGEYILDGMDVSGLDEWQLADIRNQKIGFVFQGFNLLARTSAIENVELPLLYDRSGRIKDPEARALEMLELVGLGGRIHHDPNQLSGGQQQRVAIARALVNRPAILLADEPTGNLDSLTTIEVMSVMQKLNDDGITIVMVTHEPDVSVYAKRVVVMRDGAVIKDGPVVGRKDALADLTSAKLVREEDGICVP